MAFSDNLTPQQKDDCAVLGVNFDSRVAGDLENLKVMATQKRMTDLMAKLSMLPADQQASTILTAKTTADAQVAALPAVVVAPPIKGA